MTSAAIAKRLHFCLSICSHPVHPQFCIRETATALRDGVMRERRGEAPHDCRLRGPSRPLPLSLGLCDISEYEP